MSTPRTAPPRWRVIDIVTAAILGIACGFIFVVWNQLGNAIFTALDAATPGLGGLVVGPWFIGGVLGGLIIRRPGAALFVETLAAIVSALLGSQWGIETLFSGLAQGLGAELVFLLAAYRYFTLSIAVSAGIASGVGAVILELFTSGNLAKTLEFNLIYGACTVVSGMILAGWLGYVLTRALARTGVLDRFAVGRELRREDAAESA